MWKSRVVGMLVLTISTACLAQQTSFGECKVQVATTNSPVTSSPTSAPAESPDCTAPCSGIDELCVDDDERQACVDTGVCSLTSVDVGICGGLDADCAFALEKELCQSPCLWEPSITSVCGPANGGEESSSTASPVVDLFCYEYQTSSACGKDDRCTFVIDGCSDCVLADRTSCISSSTCTWDANTFSCSSVGSTSDCYGISADGGYSDAEAKFLCSNTDGCLYRTSGYCADVIATDGPTDSPPGSGVGSGGGGGDAKCADMCATLDVSETITGVQHHRGAIV
eukprot:m.180981 g.180981  ORF g.180981 m.180981 type:complete len:283 (-) comp32043_c1_seq1:1927-2775(-)